MNTGLTRERLKNMNTGLWLLMNPDYPIFTVWLMFKTAAFYLSVREWKFMKAKLSGKIQEAKISESIFAKPNSFPICVPKMTAQANISTRRKSWGLKILWNISETTSLLKRLPKASASEKFILTRIWRKECPNKRKYDRMRIWLICLIK